MPGLLRQLVVDTAHFKYNASAEIEAFGSHLEPAPPAASPKWHQLLARTRLQPDTRHVFALPPQPERISAVRLDAYPDGGLSRVRMIGSIDAETRRRAGLTWFQQPAGRPGDPMPAPGGGLGRRRGQGRGGSAAERRLGAAAAIGRRRPGSLGRQKDPRGAQLVWLRQTAMDRVMDPARSFGQEAANDEDWLP